MLRITYWPEPTDNRPRIGREKQGPMIALESSPIPGKNHHSKENYDQQAMSRLRPRPTSSKRRLPLLPVLRVLSLWITKRLGNSSPR